MPKIIIDGRTIQCRDGITVLQAGLDVGIDVPHYCYHPGLSIVASCRLCLMEMKMPGRKTTELEWSPRLIPSCQTPVRDGLEVRFETEGDYSGIKSAPSVCPCFGSAVSLREFSITPLV